MSEVIKPATKATKTTKVKAVHGKMVHTITSQVFNPDQETEVVVDSWIQSQLDAGKLVEVK